MSYLFKLILLFIQRYWYGKLSSQYYFGLQRFREIYPNTSLTFRACFKSDVILHFDKLCVRKPDLPVYNTLDPILFDNHRWGLSYKQISNDKGKPDSAKYEWIEDKLVKVICFRDNLLERSVKTNYFFLDDRFFSGEYQFQSYNKSVLESLRNVLQAKYHCQFAGSDANFYITDNSGSLLFFNDSGYNLVVQYYFPQMLDIDQYLLKALSKSSLKKGKTPGEGKTLTEII